VNPLRTVGGRLALALLVVVGGSLAIVYLIVVPLYRTSLVDTRLKDLRHRVEAIADKPRDAPGEVFPSTTWIEDEATPEADGARVVIFSGPPLVEPVADSNSGTSRDVEHDPLVRRAAGSRGIISDAVNRDGSTYAEAAVSLKGTVLLLTTPLHNDLSSVSVVRSRVLLAASLATAFAIAMG
jgi:hypothetical protein